VRSPVSTHAKSNPRRVVVAVLAAAAALFIGVDGPGPDGDGLALTAGGAAHAASIQGPRRSALERLEEGDAIRKRLLLRGGRFELTPTVGFTLNDAFQRNLLVGAHLAYHFNDDWGLGATVMGGLAFNSGLADRIEDERPEKADAGAFSNVGFLGTVEVLYSPLVGKFALFGRSVLNYDLHLLAGLGGTLISGSSDVESATPTGVVGIGLRTFVTHGMALNIEVRDYIYSSALNSVVEPQGDGQQSTSADSSISNNFAVTIGFGFYFPQDPEVSD
jgi:outer membrane beta-barrel protein